ncbi:MAG: nucleotidyltransferase domain-containing protein [bacterium]|nr:nucleotidyltransferase domain-containing protein [bacterium]
MQSTLEAQKSAEPRKPTLVHARRAAAACIADPRVRKVSVFGSVARGKAGRHSDIDLLLLVDPAWGMNTAHITADVQAAAENAAGYPCDIVLRTPAVWKHLSQKVSASFDAAVNKHLVPLLDRDFDENEGDINDMGEPPTNESLMASSVAALSTRARGIRRVFRAIADENLDLVQDTTPLVVQIAYVSDRIKQILQETHLGIELSLKSASLLVSTTALAETHNLHQLLNALADFPEKHKMAHSVQELQRMQGGTIQNWRIAVYGNAADKLNEHITADNANAHFQAFIVCADAIMGLASQESMPSSVREASELLGMELEALKRLNVDAEYIFAGGDQRSYNALHTAGVTKLLRSQ